MIGNKTRRMVTFAVAACAAVLTVAPSVASAASISPAAYRAGASTDVTPATVSNVLIANAYAPHLCLDARSDAPNNPASNGDALQLWSCSGAANQVWAAPDPGVWGTITNSVAGKCLDAASDGANNPTVNGDRVMLWACNGGSQQQWRFVLKGNGYYAVCNKYADDRHLAMCLDAATDGANNPSINGDKVQLWSWSGATQQTWG
jgi:hypothetical protein